MITIEELQEQISILTARVTSLEHSIINSYNYNTFVPQQPMWLYNGLDNTAMAQIN